MDIEIATYDKVRYHDYIYSIVNYFKSRGIASILTNEIPKLFQVPRLSGVGISFIADNVILLRYVEAESRIRRVMSILKTRGVDHVKDVVEFEITSHGIEVEDRFVGFEGVFSVEGLTR